MIIRSYIIVFFYWNVNRYFKYNGERFTFDMKAKDKTRILDNLSSFHLSSNNIMQMNTKHLHGMLSY